MRISEIDFEAATTYFFGGAGPKMLSHKTICRQDTVLSSPVIWGYETEEGSTVYFRLSGCLPTVKSVYKRVVTTLSMDAETPLTKIISTTMVKVIPSRSFIWVILKWQFTPPPCNFLPVSLNPLSAWNLRRANVSNAVIKVHSYGLCFNQIKKLL